MLESAKLNEQLCFALYAASNRLTAIYRKVLQPMGLTYTQFVVLMALWESDGISITQLAARTNLTKATMTPLLKKLEAKALLKLERVLGNDRQKQVLLTAKGRALAPQSVAVTEEAFCASGITLSEAQAVIEICQKIGVDQA